MQNWQIQAFKTNFASLGCQFLKLLEVKLIRQFLQFQLSPKFRSTTTRTPSTIGNFISSTTERVVTPFPPIILISTTEGGSGYDPCAIPDSCGPNAICSVAGSDPVCSCPTGFSGIPRDGIPDPSHGCVRTPQKCTAEPFYSNQNRTKYCQIAKC